MKKSTIAAGLCALLTSGSLWAHGYITMPEARGFLCKQGGNSSCGAIQWEPQSLEAPTGFPSGGPADGTIIACCKPGPVQ
ncbi:lytic polysaccharide monooxygenase [Massilia sp. B-10]|nr:lytic polysaccharide monooxygenase [Massilia sp. B-10]